MTEAIGQVLAFAVAVAISPIAIMGVTLMLASARARSNGPAFVAGWVVGLAAAGTVVLLLSGAADPSERGQPADWVNVAKLVLGALLLLVAVRRWRRRPGPHAAPELPSWLQAIDDFRPRRAAGLGIVLSAANPKNLLLTVGAAAAISQTGASTGSQAVALAVFVLIATLGTGVPVAIYFALGERSRRLLEGLRERMSRDNTTIVVVLCLVIGAKLIGEAISGFTA
jgi:threonine/homoserine/homoserine lactone efflux protein